MNARTPAAKLTTALYRVKLGLSAYVSYLVACGMSQAFSEYVLYEPILRILGSRGYTVWCEHECPGIAQPGSGDKKRIDFYATGSSIEFAIEVKWVKTAKPNIKRDLEKLEAFQADKPNALALLCVFGRKSELKGLTLPAGTFKERGSAVYADLGKAKYGCRIYKLLTPKGKSR